MPPSRWITLYGSKNVEKAIELMKTKVSFLQLALTSCLFTGSGLLHAEQLISDNLVVQGLMSLGRDSQTNTSFGNDTLILRENSLQIYFDDTSTTTGFPSNDWRITCNDTGTNGASYFGIDDATGGKRPFRIDAGAPANGFYMANSGKIGLRTSNPALDLHIATGDTPALRLEQNSTAGWTPWTWDIGANEANFFVRDLTAGSRLPFRIRPGAPTSSIDIAASGKVGIGTDKAHAKLHVEADTANGEGMIIGKADDVSTNLATLHVKGSGYFAQKLGIGTNSASQSTTLYVDGTAFISKTLEIGSSRTRKENIHEVTLDEAHAALDELNPVHFNYKGDDEHQLGFIAEDVPDLVATKNRKSIVPMDFVAVLTKVVQDHERREKELQQTVASQEQTLKLLSEKLAAMEERIRNATTKAR